MANILIDDIPVLTFEYKPFINKYWNIGLSEFIIDKYGKETKFEHKEVESVLISCFNFFVEKFKILLHKQDTESFYHCVFILHEASIDLYIKQLEGFQLPSSIDSDFPKYRRILKLMMEQACNIDLTARKSTPFQEILRTIQELYYIGIRVYEFANSIAYMKMISEAYYIKFEGKIFTYDWQHNYGLLNGELMKEFSFDYETFFDKNALSELKEALEASFRIDYNKALGLISLIKKHFSDKSYQTIEPYVLPINLAQECQTSKKNTTDFYLGLTINRNNKLSIEDAVLKPHSEKRYMYRPILAFTVDGVERALIGEKKVAESMMILATNTIHWNTMPEEWLKNEDMVKFMNKKSLEHDRLLENEIQKIFVSKYPFCRNIKSFKQKQNKPNVKIDIKDIGEIDFIVVNKDKKKIFIADTKYNKARYDAVGYRTDYTNFKGYEVKLNNKEIWLKNNLQVLQLHIEEMFHISYSILDFDVEAIFFINTPTFYMFNGKYKAITLIRIKDFIEGSWDYPTIKIRDEVNSQNFIYSHPYYSKSLTIQKME